MNLVLVSRANIDHLENLAISNFSDVPNKDAKLKEFFHETPFDETNLGHIYKVIPNKDIKRLSISWILPYSEEKWRSKPNNYITHLLGHEGPNSLLSHLIKTGYATSLSSSHSHRMRCLDMMGVDITLTELGEINYPKVMEIVYSYINKIK